MFVILYNVLFCGEWLLTTSHSLHLLIQHICSCLSFRAMMKDVTLHEICSHNLIGNFFRFQETSVLPWLLMKEIWFWVLILVQHQWRFALWIQTANMSYQNRLKIHRLMSQVIWALKAISKMFLRSYQLSIVVSLDCQKIN